MNVYEVGELVRCSGVFTNQAGSAVDPSTVTFRVRKPDDTVTAYVYGTDEEVVKDATGNYHVDVSATTSGRWFYRWEGGGTGQSAGEKTFRVQASRVL